MSYPDEEAIVNYRGIVKQIAEDDYVCLACGAVNEWDEEVIPSMLGHGSEGTTICKRCGSKEWDHAFGGGFVVMCEGAVILQGSFSEAGFVINRGGVKRRISQ